MECKEEKHINWKSMISIVIIVSSLFVMLYLLLRNHDIEEIRNLIFSLKRKWLLASIGCMILSYLADMMCFYEITKKIYGKASIRTSFRVTMAGAYFNSVTPFACGGEPFQISYLMGDGVPMGSCANIIMAKSTLFQTSVFFYSILSYAINAGSLYRLVNRFDLFFFTGVFINLIVILFYGLFLINKTAAKKAVNVIFKLLGKFHVIKNPEKYTQKREEEIEHFTQASKLLLNDAWVIIKIFFFQFLNLTLTNVIPYFLRISLEQKYDSVVDIITSQAILRQITAYIPSPGGAGGTEGISYFFFMNFFTKFPVLSVILIWRLLTYYFNIVFSGLYLMIIKNKKVSAEIRQIESDRAA